MVSPDHPTKSGSHRSKKVLDCEGFFIYRFDPEVEYSHVITFEIKG